MNNSALINLRDIHLPEAISWWPLAYGWYAVILLLILLLSIGGLLLWRYYYWGLAKRAALKQLANYIKLFQQNNDLNQACANISALLRNVALAYYPRIDVAGLYGDLWLNFLHKTGGDFQHWRICLLDMPYKITTNELRIDIMQFFMQVKLWIKSQGKPCL